MSTFLPREVQAGLDKARIEAQRTSSRLRLQVGERTYPVLRMWKTGFAVEPGTVPVLRGYVDLYDGAAHLFQCLIVASDDQDAGEMRYEFKRLTAVTDRAALDFERAADAPVGLLESQAPGRSARST